jgi:hypothetical protein
MERIERENKCIYCDNNNKAEHFICEDCGCGMCNDCYDEDAEHTEHTFDFSEMIEDNNLYNYISEKIGVDYGYMCYDCITEREIEFDNKGGKNE